MNLDSLDRLQPLADVLFRVMLSGIFIIAGFSHLANPAQTAARLEASPLGFLATGLADASLLVILSGVFLFIGGVALALGFKTRLAALGLIALIIPITVTVQMGSLDALGPLFKNIGLTGGLFYFVAYGSKTASVDARLALRSSRRIERAPAPAE